MRKLLILTDTNVGGRAGAEKHLKVLLSNIDYGRVQIDAIGLNMDGKAPAHIPDLPLGPRIMLLSTSTLCSVAGMRRVIDLWFRIRRERYDCIMSLFESSDLLCALLAPLLRKPLLISNRRDTGFNVGRLMRRLYGLINWRFDYVIAVSSAVKQALVEQGIPESKIRTIYNAVDVDRFSSTDRGRIRRALNIPDNGFVVAAVANLLPVKDHLTLLDAVIQLHRSGRPLHLVLAGDGPLRSQIEATAKRMGVSDRVHLLGRRDDVPDILADCDVFALTSLTEGMSNALLEAMAAGRAVVATAVGGNIDVVADGVDGFLIPPRDCVALQTILARLYDEPDIRHRIGAAAQRTITERFGIPTMIGSYNRLLLDAESGV